MALDYARVMDLPPIETVQQLSKRDTILYALGVGVGAAACTEPAELQYVYEDGLRALPTMAMVLGYPGFWQARAEYGFTWRKALHGEQVLEIHCPLPVEGEIRAVTSIEEIFDKGPDKGALVLSRRDIHDADGRRLATTRQTTFLRADGGFGGRTDGAPVPAALPGRPPDLCVSFASAVNQALLYRLSGDFNPVHADPAVAAQAGFAKPILHGAATYGLAGRVLTRELCNDQPVRVRSMQARFSSPAYPGDAFKLDIWKEGPGLAAFRVRAPERNALVLSHGLLTFGD